MEERFNQLEDDISSLREELSLLKTEQSFTRNQDNLVLQYPPTIEDTQVILEVVGDVGGGKDSISGIVAGTGVPSIITTGVTITRLAPGLYQINHSLGLLPITVSMASTSVCSVSSGINSAIVENTANTDAGFSFIGIKPN